MFSKEIYFTKDNGQRVAGLAYIPGEEASVESGIKYPVVIFAHGFNGNYRGLMHHGEGFAENGIVCIFFDFCGGGIESKSDGSLQDMTVLTEIEDLEFVVNQTAKLSYVDEQQIFLQGESMGGFVSAYVATKISDKIRAMVLWYPAFVIPDDSRSRYEKGDNTCFGLKLNSEFNESAMNIDIYSMIGTYEGNVKIIHGDKDEIVPIAYSKKAVMIYKNASLDIIPGAGHGYDGEDSVRARELSVEFIKNNLRC